MDEADVERILAYPETMIGSDGLPHDEFPHPRLWGAFPRVLGHYARERGLFSLEAGRAQDDRPAGRSLSPRRARPHRARACAPTSSCSIPQRIADTATFAQPDDARRRHHAVS